MRTIKGAVHVVANQPKGTVIGMTNGCFDILHPGHIEFLENAKAQCYFLLVGVNSDSSVERLKGKPRPFMNHNDRCQIVQSLKPVDFAFVFLGLDFSEAIMAIKPHLWFKSTPWTHETLSKPEVQAAKAVGAEVRILPSFGDWSSTQIVEKINQSRLSSQFRYGDHR